MSKTKTPSDDPEDAKASDNDLFHEAMKGVKPIKKVDRVSIPKLPISKKMKGRPREFETTHEIKQYPKILLTDHVAYPIAAEEHLVFSQPALAKKYLLSLRRGKLKVEATLDLHGLTVENAREALQLFIDHALAEQYRVVKIIHGKGQRNLSDSPILKNKVNVWLRQYKDVLAFSSALAKDGGTGALYVLLKRER